MEKIDPKKLLAKLNFDPLLSQIWNQVDKLSMLGVYTTSFELPENIVLADMLFDELSKHDAFTNIELKESTEEGNELLVLVLNFTPKKNEATRTRTRKSKC